MPPGDAIDPWRAIGRGFFSLTRAPFRLLLILFLAISLVAEGQEAAVPLGQSDLVIVVAFIAIQVYIQIALVLAAGSNDPVRSTDAWLKSAWRRRCFWRFFIASILATLAVAVGAAILLVGAFVAGALVGLAQSAAALERASPIEALFRSANLSRRARVKVGIVFGLLILIPGAGVQAAALLGLSERIGAQWSVAVVVGEIASAAGLIALTRMFVALGGTPSPPLDRMAPAPPARSA